MKTLLFLLGLAVINSFINLNRMFLTIYYCKKFESHSPNMDECAASVEYLFDKAGTNWILGATMYRGQRISQCLEAGIPRHFIVSTFHKTISTFRFRAVNSFNPLYWFEMPSRLLNRHGIALPAPIKILVQIFFWVITVILGHCLELGFDNFFLPQLPNILSFVK